MEKCPACHYNDMASDVEENVRETTKDPGPCEFASKTGWQGSILDVNKR
jgi:hypothetical protein